jgi:NAD(P)-dependent dehydrogenase (short-subunit alcohol dehydrogenase family)
VHASAASPAEDRERRRGLRGAVWAIRSSANEPVVLGGRWFRRAPVAGRRVLVTGASAGIGRAAVLRLAAAGAQVIAVARRADELAEVAGEAEAAGGRATYHRCDLTRHDEVAALVDWVTRSHGGVDILVNNAARSIRRPVLESLDRVHDFERTMALNYLGPVRLTLGLLPAIVASGSGQVVNIGTWTVPVGSSPRFAAYHSSKVALTGFGRCVGAELADHGVHVTTVHYPLVHTEMSARNYASLPGLTPHEAAGWIEAAIRRRPVRIMPRYACLLGAVGLVAPGPVDGFLRRFG